MTPRRRWIEMPTTAFGPGAADWVAVLPLAAVEQHGPHLPVGVDTLAAEGYVARAIAALPDTLPVTFLPVQAVALSPEHIRFPGTLTLDWDTAMRVWLEIGASVARAGVRRLVLVTSHGGNAAAMEVVARQLRLRHGMLAVTTSWGRLSRWRDIYPPADPMIDIHAGQSETSVLRALHPGLVDMAAARDFRSAQEAFAARHRHLALHGGAANAAWIAGDLNPAGAVGDAASARADWGEAEIASAVAGFVALMAEVAACPLPEA
ncbi:MAG: creatininase family protein [Gemmobacter sp.]